MQVFTNIQAMKFIACLSLSLAPFDIQATMAYSVCQVTYLPLEHFTLLMSDLSSIEILLSC